MKCLFCNKPLSLMSRLRDVQFCDEAHRQRYMQESRWRGVPLRLEQSGPALCDLVAYDPPCVAVDAPKRAMVVRPTSFPKGERIWPSAGKSIAPQCGPETQTPLPLEMPAPRNAPRRRFTYRWANQGAIREMMKEAAMRVRMRYDVAASSVCEPAGEMVEFELAPMTLPAGSPVRWQAMAGIDDTALESVRVVGLPNLDSQSRALPQLATCGKPVAMPCPMEKLKAETPLAPIESTKAARGIYIPLVSIPLLRPRVAFGARPAAPGAQRVTERSGVIIPIREFQLPERAEAAPLARII